MSSTSEGTAAGADSGTSAAVLLLAPSPPHAVQPRCSRSRQSGPEKALKKRVYVLSRRLQSLAHDHVVSVALLGRVPTARSAAPHH